MNGVDSEILARTPVPQLPPLPLIFTFKFAEITPNIMLGLHTGLQSKRF